MITARTTSVDETRACAAALASLVTAGDVLVLAGDLGAGKTAFTQGFGAALGVTDPITSPTFTLHNRYEGRVQVDHVDVYRLADVDEVLEAGLFELLDDGGVLLIEWGDMISRALPADFLEVRLTLGDGDDDRTIGLTPVGPRWSARARAISDALGQWTEGPAPC